MLLQVSRKRRPAGIGFLKHRIQRLFHGAANPFTQMRLNLLLIDLNHLVQLLSPLRSPRPYLAQLSFLALAVPVSRYLHTSCTSQTYSPQYAKTACFLIWRRQARIVAYAPNLSGV